MSKAPTSLTNQYLNMKKNKNSLSNMIKNFFNVNKGAKIGTIEENNQIVQITQDDIDIDSSNTSIQEASPTDILFELDKKTKPTRMSHTRTSKKTASISGGNSRKSKTPKSKKSKTPKSKKSKTLKKYKNKK